MSDEIGNKVLEATPSIPVDLIDFDKAPDSGDALVVLNNGQNAKEIAERLSNNKKPNKKTVKSINQMMPKI